MDTFHQDFVGLHMTSHTLPQLEKSQVRHQIMPSQLSQFVLLLWTSQVSVGSTGSRHMHGP